MIIFLFLAILAVTLGIGGWLVARFTRARYEIDALLAEHQRDWAVNDAADMATDAWDWGER